MKKYIDLYIDDLKNVKRKSENTVKSTKSDLYKMADFFEGTGITDVRKVTSTGLNAYIFQLEKGNMSLSTISRYISSIKAFFLFLMINRYIDEEPASRLKPPKVVKTTPKVLSVNQIDTLMSVVDETSNIGIRDAAILEVLYSTGMKASELVELKLDNIDLNVGFVLCHSQQKERRIPIGRSGISKLNKYLNMSRVCLVKTHSEYLFVNYKGEKMSRQSVWKIIKQYGDKAGLGELAPHTLRDSFAAHLIERGASIQVVSELLGHSDITTTQIYADFANNRVREMYTNTHPHS